jgi:hypothetical protein
MLTAITQRKIPEIESILEEVKAADKEENIERLQESIQQLDKAVFSLLVEIFWWQRGNGKMSANTYGKRGQ